ncbi:Mu transposase domain-containing protein [Bradyrhizobium sp. Pa8]|uniref:Mu transposase domain-containing protein n=1 Tax=Bradyrhizobium sp. Pa8 TaxID=3386552 RepID=UPI00403F2808
MLRQYGRTWRRLFEEGGAPNHKPFLGEPWVHAERRRCWVGLDYHVEIERHYYSVPYRFAPREAEAQICVRTCDRSASACLAQNPRREDAAERFSSRLAECASVRRLEMPGLLRAGPRNGC